MQMGRTSSVVLGPRRVSARGGGLTIAHGTGGGVSLPVAPAIDTPIITGGPGSAAFTGQASHSLKRIGDNTTNVDLAGDTKFRYPGVPDNALVPNISINSRVNSSRIPGGDAQARNWEIQIETVTSSKFYGLNYIAAPANTPFLVIVNGRVVNGAAFVITTSGSANFLLLEFPDNRSRRVKLIFQGGNTVLNLLTETAYPPVRPTGNATVLLTIGDSLSAGSGGPPTGATAMDTWPHYAALMLGFDHCCNASIGGTRWVQTGSGDVAISHFGGGRLTPALTTNPAAVAFAGSRNDSGANQAALDAITAAVGDALDATAVTKKFVMGTFTALTNVNLAVKAGADAKGIPFIDMTDGLQPEDIGADLVHPTYAGAVNLRNRIAPRLRTAGCNPA